MIMNDADWNLDERPNLNVVSNKIVILLSKSAHTQFSLNSHKMIGREICRLTEISSMNIIIGFRMHRVLNLVKHYIILTLIVIIATLSIFGTPVFHRNASNSYH